MPREWREDFIYFLMVDRFADGAPRSPVLTPDPSRGIANDAGAYHGYNTANYLGVGSVPVERADNGTHHVTLPLDGHQFVILS